MCIIDKSRKYRRKYQKIIFNQSFHVPGTIQYYLCISLAQTLQSEIIPYILLSKLIIFKLVIQNNYLFTA